jgi:hypothetical protein
VPFYDRTGLIYETLGTLEEALSLQILITIIVIIIMVMHLRTSLVISALLPLAVLMSFIMMKYVGVDANVVALAGIAISIGTVVDMGIILTENMLKHIDEKNPGGRSAGNDLPGHGGSKSGRDYRTDDHHRQLSAGIYARSAGRDGCSGRWRGPKPSF